MGELTTFQKLVARVKELEEKVKQLTKCTHPSDCIVGSYPHYYCGVCGTQVSVYGTCFLLYMYRLIETNMLMLLLRL